MMEGEMMAHVEIDRAMAGHVAMVVDPKVVVVPMVAALMIAARKVAGLTADVDRMVLLPVVLVDRVRVDPRVVLVVDPEVPVLAVLGAADAVPTNLVPAPSPGEWMRSTTSWIESSEKLKL